MEQRLSNLENEVALLKSVKPDTNIKPKIKREPSAYNKFVKNFIKEKCEKGARDNLTRAAEAWRNENKTNNLIPKPQ